ncbi:MAG: hypothetical protein QME96_06160, partial [Myxococcota bacterium]|nr:hypothetical protein [Myxococcota bacterium]
RTAPPPRTQSLPPVIEKLPSMRIRTALVALAAAATVAAGCARDPFECPDGCPEGMTCVYGTCVADRDEGSDDTGGAHDAAGDEGMPE